MTYLEESLCNHVYTQDSSYSYTYLIMPPHVNDVIQCVCLQAFIVLQVTINLVGSYDY